MNCSIHFNREIRLFISEQINAANTSIHTAVAWITDPELINALNLKKTLIQGLILNDDHINKSENFSKYRSRVHFLRPENGALMHHKFCVIDSRLVITGSYNWTLRAGNENHENIICIEDPKIAQLYLNEFESLKSVSRPFADRAPLAKPDAIQGIENFEALSLEQKFNFEIEQKLAAAQKLGVGQMVADLVAKHSAVVVAKLLLRNPTEIYRGFERLYNLGKLDLTFEESVIKKIYAPLFTDSEISAAKGKLSMREFFIDRRYAHLMNKYQD